MNKILLPPGICPTCRVPLDIFRCRLIKILDAPRKTVIAVVPECHNPKSAK